MSPPLVGRSVLAVGPLDVDDVERYDQILGTVDPVADDDDQIPWRAKSKYAHTRSTAVLTSRRRQPHRARIGLAKPNPRD